jgi:hypothetical protein
LQTQDGAGAILLPPLYLQPLQNKQRAFRAKENDCYSQKPILGQEILNIEDDRNKNF